MASEIQHYRDKYGATNFPFQDLTAIIRKDWDIAKEHFENIGAFFAELAFAWFASDKRLARLFRIEGREHLDAALAKGHGVLLVSGHFTPLEICTPAIKPLVPLFAFMYTPRRNVLLDAFQSRGRERSRRPRCV